MSEEKANRCAVGLLGDFLEWMWPNDAFVSACELHDVHYSQGSWASKNLSQEEIDLLFKRHLWLLKRYAPLGWLRAPLYYFAVRAGGRWFWDGQHSFFEDRKEK